MEDTEDRKQLTDLCKEHGMKITSMKLTRRTDRPTTQWDVKASHWFCKVDSMYLTGEVTCFYSMGSGCKGKPTADDVLGCLLSDACSADQSFEDWSDDMDLSNDSIRAQGMYEASRKTLRDLKDFLGNYLSDFQDAEH